MRTSKENARYRMESKPPFTCLAVANFFIDQGVKYNSPVTNLKLQKLIYFTHCDLVLQHKQAMLDEEPQAWRNGPVFPGIHHRFKYFGDGTIRFPMDLAFDIFPMIKDEDVLNKMRTVWKQYRDYTGNELSEITHSAGGAWEKLYNPEELDVKRTITVEHILNHKEKY
ncbi:Panacea domain-containing protein [Candidatus Liberibacter solanacearum]|nr:type II toxin-antitoxin system antitoxin SocA domain-containing protein [Candidatus Liberibacter solanacearum]